MAVGSLTRSNDVFIVGALSWAVLMRPARGSLLLHFQIWRMQQSRLKIERSRRSLREKAPQLVLDTSRAVNAGTIRRNTTTLMSVDWRDTFVYRKCRGKPHYCCGHIIDTVASVLRPLATLTSPAQTPALTSIQKTFSVVEAYLLYLRFHLCLQ